MQQQLKGRLIVFKGKITLKRDLLNKTTKLDGFSLTLGMVVVPDTQEAETDCKSLDLEDQHVQHSQTLLKKYKRPITWHFRKYSSYFQHNNFQRCRPTIQYMKIGILTLLNQSIHD